MLQAWQTFEERLRPSTSSTFFLKVNMGVFPSGQRGQTVNLLRFASVVRIHPLPPEKDLVERQGLFQLSVPNGTINTPSVCEVVLRIVKCLRA